MLKRNHGIIHELDLFHGSGSIDPLEITCGEDGFDLQLSCGGSWRYAIYLSVPSIQHIVQHQMSKLSLLHLIWYNKEGT